MDRQENIASPLDDLKTGLNLTPRQREMLLEVAQGLSADATPRQVLGAFAGKWEHVDHINGAFDDTETADIYQVGGLSDGREVFVNRVRDRISSAERHVSDYLLIFQNGELLNRSEHLEDYEQAEREIPAMLAPQGPPPGQSWARPS